VRRAHHPPELAGWAGANVAQTIGPCTNLSPDGADINCGQTPIYEPACWSSRF